MVDKKVVVITGGSSGIGASCAKIFGQNGYDLVIASRNLENLHNLAVDLGRAGIKVQILEVDVSDELQCAGLIEKTMIIYGRIDVLINNAGVSMRALFADVDLSVIRKIMAVNFWGTVYCTKYALPHLIRSNGSIIGVSSIAGKKGLPGRSGYTNLGDGSTRYPRSVY